MRPTHVTRPIVVALATLLVLAGWVVAEPAGAVEEPVAACGEGASGPFVDVEGTHPFCESIDWMATEGISTGYDDDTFRPVLPVSRQAMAAFLWRYAGEPAVVVTEPIFADVGSDHPFFAAIQWMGETELSTGTAQPGDDPLYRPGVAVSRQAMSAFLWRYGGEPAAWIPQPYFADVPEAHQFFAPIQWMGETALSTGTLQPGKRPAYKPTDAVSRQAMAAFLFRFDRAGSLECDAAVVLAHVDAALSVATMAPLGPWVIDGLSTVFDARSRTAEGFRSMLGLDCAVRATYHGGGVERLLLAAWTGHRITFVVQATDAPATAFQPKAIFDLLIESTYGQFLDGGTFRNPERATWAATMAGGESIVLTSFDYSLAATAKGWQAGFDPGDPDEWISLDSEQFGIDRLREFGARNVGIAELPEIGSEIGSLQAVTPAGQILETRVAPLGWIDPTTDWLGTGTTPQMIDGVQVWVVDGGPDDDSPWSFSVAHVSFECGAYVWHVITGYGTTAELVGFVTDLLGILTC